MLIKKFYQRLQCPLIAHPSVNRLLLLSRIHDAVTPIHITHQRRIRNQTISCQMSLRYHSHFTQTESSSAVLRDQKKSYKKCLLSVDCCIRRNLCITITETREPNKIKKCRNENTNCIRYAWWINCIARGANATQKRSSSSSSMWKGAGTLLLLLLSIIFPFSRLTKISWIIMYLIIITFGLPHSIALPTIVCIQRQTASLSLSHTFPISIIFIQKNMFRARKKSEELRIRISYVYIRVRSSMHDQTALCLHRRTFFVHRDLPPHARTIDSK